MSQQFIILSTARTGSNLLISLLNKNTKVKTDGEIFNFFSLKKENLISVLNNPKNYLNRHLKSNNLVEAKGFKIFYNHCLKGCLNFFRQKKSEKDFNQKFLKDLYKNEEILNQINIEEKEEKIEEIWNLIKNNKNIKVIHLKRLNILNTFISLKTAFLTNMWVTKNTNEISDPILKLDYEECLNFFKRIKNYEKKYDEFFSDHEKIEVTYEELVNNQEVIMRKIFVFLEVEYVEGKSALKKQSKKSLKDRIQNYYELKEKFKNTPYIYYFED